MHSMTDIRDRMVFWRGLRNFGFITGPEYYAILRWMMQEKRNAK